MTLASSLPVEHRPQTRSRHPCLSCAAASICFRFIPLSCILFVQVSSPCVFGTEETGSAIVLTAPDDERRSTIREL